MVSPVKNGLLSMNELVTITSHYLNINRGCKITWKGTSLFWWLLLASCSGSVAPPTSFHVVLTCMFCIWCDLWPFCIESVPLTTFHKEECDEYLVMVYRWAPTLVFTLLFSRARWYDMSCHSKRPHTHTLQLSLPLAVGYGPISGGILQTRAEVSRAGLSCLTSPSAGPRRTHTGMTATLVYRSLLCGSRIAKSLCSDAGSQQIYELT